MAMPNNRLPYSAGYHNLVRPHVKHIPVVQPHAVLSSEGRVIMIGYYPPAKDFDPNSSVVPIGDNETCHVGYYYNRKTRRFSKMDPNA